MPDNLKDTIRRIFHESINEGKLDVLDEIYDANCVRHRVPFPDLENLEASKELIVDARTSYPDLQVTVEDVLLDGDKSAIRFRFRGTQTGKSPTTGVAATGKIISYTGCVVSHWKNEFAHVPIQAAVSERKKIDSNGWLWNSVLAAIGQPREMH